MKCLVIDDMHPDIGSRLSALGLDMDYRPGMDKTTLERELPQYPILICRTRIYIDDALMALAPNLQLIVRAGAGLDDIDLEAAARRGITVLNAPEGNRDAVAEHTIGLLLALLNKIPQAHASVSEKKWERELHRGNELGRLTVSLLGYGHMGQATAKRLTAFGCTVQAYDKYLTAWPEGGVASVSLEELFNTTDVLSIHLPLTPETNQYCHYDFWQRFKKPIWVINTARGGIVPLEDLATALDEGKILGAALDVLENEKLHTLTEKQHQAMLRLMAKPSVIMTPHVAGWSYESYQRINEVVAHKISLWFSQKTV